ncbi:MAG: hypothetical protein ACM31E_07070, partial [Fibrobacterota bacterium]
MSRFYAQLMVLAAFGVAFCQGITESVPVETKDSTIVNAVPAAGDSIKRDTIPTIDTKAVIVDAKPDSLADVPQKDPSEMIADSAAVQNPPDVPLVPGEQVAEDTVKAVKLSVQPAAPEKKNAGGRNGIGVNLTVKLIVSTALNEYLDDLYEKMKDDANGMITKEAGFSAMPVMMGLKVKGIVYVGPVLGLEPFGAINYGVK